jgi:hypothetical protein
MPFSCSNMAAGKTPTRRQESSKELLLLNKAEAESRYTGGRGEPPRDRQKHAHGNLPSSSSNVSASSVAAASAKRASRVKTEEPGLSKHDKTRIELPETFSDSDSDSD